MYYLCSANNCETIVTTTMGEKALDPKLHLLVKPKAPKRKERNDHCIWTQDIAEVGNEEEEDNEEKEEEEKEEEEKEEEVRVVEEGGAASRTDPPGETRPAQGLDGDEFRPPTARRGFMGGKEKKDKICSHLRKGYCHHSLSGKKPFKGKDGKVREECPFSHPRTCPKLLNNGAKGKYGCDGTCDKFHPKMCPESLKLNRCDRDCKRGYHVRANSFAMKEERKKEEKTRKEKEERTRKEQEERLRRWQQSQLDSRGRHAAPWVEHQRFIQEQPNLPPPQTFNIPPPTYNNLPAPFLEQLKKVFTQAVMTCLQAAPTGLAGAAPSPVVAPPSLAPAPIPTPTWAQMLRV